MRRDRKDRRLEEILPGILKQPWIALTSYDLIVDPPGLLARAYLADQLLAIFPDREFHDRRRFRNRKEVCPFERIRSVVPEYLLDSGRRDLTVDLRIELDRFDR